MDLMFGAEGVCVCGFVVGGIRCLVGLFFWALDGLVDLSVGGLAFWGGWCSGGFVVGGRG